ncbi:MAG: translation initiation factor IF-2 [Candidatus Omnitrophica bacterium]|nr:translation initiation factor IF-2 [Candidatus Omnitrophota bacterium]MDD5080480.1 translation initiation factor IF-2 [Candidatus Omnitrophota bacterium]MDD5440740.1 translation initiation factor IF-2 [Candidatus Omnitrophota bacterium]
MRIYELAKKIGIDTKELIAKLEDMNIVVKNHMSSLDSDTAEIVMHELADLEKKEIEDNVLMVDFPITVKDLAVKLNKKPSELLGDLIKKGKFFNINHNLDEKAAGEIAYDYKINLKKKLSCEEEALNVESGEMLPRPAIITLMGHIDHGKTSVLDYIRKSRIADKETGGITQHIGAYQVKLGNGSISFLDTPGHETFTAMRARGADITDIVIIVVAADEGIKPQTIEAIDHAKAANVPILVAINKIDRPNADVDMVKQQLSKHDLVPEDWGGKTITVPVSAKTGDGIKELLEMILLQAEILELKADPGRTALGVVVEAKLSKGRGPVAAVLIRTGTLKVGDWCVCGQYMGRVRALHDDKGNIVRSAPPSFPVEVLGLNGVPNPGDQLFVVQDEKNARSIVGQRREKEEKDKIVPPTHMRLEDLYEKVKADEVKQLKVIIKADVGGTLEAVEHALIRIESKEVELNIVHKGVGAINSSDVLLAEVSDAVIVGFKAVADAQTREMAKSKGIEIRVYQIIYELIDDVKGALEGMLTPHIKKTFLGRARVKTVFKLSKSGIIAGCIVEKGKFTRGVIAQVTRGNEIIHEGKIQSLKRFKDDVKDVAEGYECGIGVGYNDLQEGDLIDGYTEERVMRKLK